MLETLLPQTRSIVRLLEEKMSARVRIVASAPGKLRTFDSREIPALDSDEFAISYNSNSPAPNYAIAHQALRLIRFYESDPSDRWMMRGTQEHLDLAATQMEREMRDNTGEVRTLGQHWIHRFYFETLRLLSCTPSDVWLHKRMLADYPALRSELEIAQERLFSKAHRCLGQQVESAMPKSVYRAANGLNCAFGIALDGMLGVASYSAPYREHGFYELGQRLNALNPADRGHAGDIAARDTFAKELGLLGWYEWVKFSG